MDKLFRGVLRYNKSAKSTFLTEIKRIGETTKPHTMIVSCMDSRVFPSRFTDLGAGQTFLVRNAGNMVPHYRLYSDGNVIDSVGPGLELSVVVNNAQNVVVCGHSDCKAMQALYNLREDCNHLKFKKESLLKTWIALHGHDSIQTMYKSSKPNEKSDEYRPMVCSFNIGNQDVTAHIDPDNNFSIQDKLSQLHCLQQASNFSSYPFLEEKMSSGKLKVHSMWFDTHSGDVYVFSPRLQRFAVINESSVDEMLSDVTS